MIGSVTKLTLYAVSLAATHKDEVEKRDALLKDRLSDHRFDAPRMRIVDISRDNESLDKWRTIDISGNMNMVGEFCSLWWSAIRSNCIYRIKESS